MNHHQLSNLLFENQKDLTAEQTHELRSHLQSCEQCQALASALVEMETTFDSTVFVEPAQGFSTRWQSRLEAKRLHLHKRQIIRMLVLVGTCFVILASALFFLHPSWLLTPNQIVWTVIYQYFSFITYLSTVRGFLVSLLRHTPPIAPFFLSALIIGLVSELVVLWVVFYRLVTRQQRVSV